MLTIMFKEKHLLQGIYLEGQSLSDFAYCFYESLLCFTVICLLLVADACVEINFSQTTANSTFQA